MNALSIYRKHVLKNSHLISTQDGQAILSYVIRKSFSYLITYDPKMSWWQYFRYLFLLNQRKRGKPLAYIVKEIPFYEDIFVVNRHVLIPRPETEFLVDYVVKNELLKPRMNILDIGTGSGNIVISLAKKHPHAHFVAIDVSRKGLCLAKANAEKILGKNHKIIFILMDIRKVKESINGTKFDLIIANPPYISKKELDEVEDSVYRYEPHQALFAKEDGLAIIKSIGKNAKNLLNEKGGIIIEFGINQTEKIKKMFTEFPQIRILKDQNEIERFFLGYKK